jgi:tetratricopeptide (TPR) repeat protein
MPPFAWALAGIGAIGAIVTICWFVWWILEKRRARVVDPVAIEQIKEEVHDVKSEVGRILDYLDGLPQAQPKIKDPFEEGLEHKKKYEYDEAIKSFRYALTKEPTGSQKAALLLLIGNCFFEQSRFAEAEGHYKEAVATAIEANEQTGLAATYNNIGLIYDSKGDYDKALEWYQKSKKITEQFGDQAGIATTYNNIGGIYDSKGDYDRALEWYQKSLKITGQIGDQAGLAATYNNIGGIYDSKGDYDKALEWYQKSLKITEQIGAKEIGAKDKIEIVRRNIEGLKAQGQKK